MAFGYNSINRVNVGINDVGPRRIAFSPQAFGQNGLTGSSPTKASLRGTNPVRANKTNKEKHKDKNADKKKQADNKEKDKQDKPGSQPPYMSDSNPEGGQPFDGFNVSPDLGRGPTADDAESPGESWTLCYNGDRTYLCDTTTESLFHIEDVSDNIPMKFPTSPLENGMVVHDHKVREPITMQVKGLVKSKNTAKVREILKAAVDSYKLSDSFELSSTWEFYTLYLSGYTSKADSSRYDVYEFTLKFTEIMLADTKVDTTMDANAANKMVKGGQTPKR